MSNIENTLIKNSLFQLNLIKIWQDEKGCLIVKVLCKSRQENTSLQKTKFFLSINFIQDHFGIRIEKDKPHNLKSHQAFISLVRKYIPLGLRIKINKSDEQEKFWIIFSNDKRGVYWVICLEKKQPPVLSLISAASEVLIRQSQSGVYTKKKKWDISDDLEKWIKSSTYEITDEIISLNFSEDQTSQNSPKEEQKNPLDIDVSLQQKKLRKQLLRKRKTIRKSVQNLEAKKPKDLKILKLKAELLRSHIHLLSEGQKLLVINPKDPNLKDFFLESSFEEKNFKIDLDPQLSAGKNLIKYFTEVKKLEKADFFLEKQSRKSQVELENIDSDISYCSLEELTEDKIIGLRKKYSLKENTSKESTNSYKSENNSFHKRVKTFINNENIRILVGKNSEDNEFLTRSAKANDYWFHVVGSSGSHVLIPALQLKNKVLSEKSKREAAILAIYYSKKKKNNAGEVYFTRRQYLSKKKGQAPGLWAVEKSELLFFHYDDQELKDVLNGAVFT